MGCDNGWMRAEWSAECGADDPVLVVPWHSEEEPDRVRFVDLRENPYDLDQIPEAEAHPALLQALRALNAGRSPVFTAKCDAWTMDAEELDGLREELEQGEVEAPCGFVSYVDLVWRERTLFVSFPQCEQRVMRLARLLEGLDQAYAAVDCVLRPALVDLPGALQGRAQEGYCVSLYVKALGTDAAHAYSHWADALAAVVGLMRGGSLAQVRSVSPERKRRSKQQIAPLRCGMTTKERILTVSGGSQARCLVWGEGRYNGCR